MRSLAEPYIHGRSAEEAARLEVQASFIGAVLLDRVEIPHEPDRVLDLGCGIGAMTRRLIERGAAHPYAVDFSPLQIAEARRRTPAGAASFSVADGRHLPFPDGRFDLVYTSWFLEHVPHPREILREAYRVLAPGGSYWAGGEVENSSLLLWPRSEPLERAWSVFNDLQAKMGGDPFVGRKLYGHLVAAGFESIDVFCHSMQGNAGHPELFAGLVHEFVGILKSARSAVEASGRMAMADYDRAIEDLAGVLHVPGGTFTYTFMRGRAVKERRGRR